MGACACRALQPGTPARRRAPDSSADEGALERPVCRPQVPAGKITLATLERSPTRSPTRVLARRSRDVAMNTPRPWAAGAVPAAGTVDPERRRGPVTPLPTRNVCVCVGSGGVGKTTTAARSASPAGAPAARRADHRPGASPPRRARHHDADGEPHRVPLGRPRRAARSTRWCSTPSGRRRADPTLRPDGAAAACSRTASTRAFRPCSQDRRAWRWSGCTRRPAATTTARRRHAADATCARFPRGAGAATAP